MLNWITSQAWTPVLETGSADDKATVFARMIDNQMDKLLPRKTLVIKSTADDPWITEAIKRRIRATKSIFNKEKHSEMRIGRDTYKRLTDEMIR